MQPARVHLPQRNLISCAVISAPSDFATNFPMRLVGPNLHTGLVSESCGGTDIATSDMGVGVDEEDLAVANSGKCGLQEEAAPPNAFKPPKYRGDRILNDVVGLFHEMVFQ